MCIALLSTAHPTYKLILIDNRDEFLNRPTASATWWPSPHSHVLGGRDLLRPEQGTWLGLTRSGRIAVLTNFREDTAGPPSAVSRGAIIKDFLTDESDRSTDEYVRDVIADKKIGNVGGFSLVCGRMGESLAIMTNRSISGGSPSSIPKVMGEANESVGLSNAAFGDSGWKKVEDGERLMKVTIKDHVAGKEDEAELIQRLLKLLSTDTLPRKSEKAGGLEAYIGELRHTIFVPAIGQKAVQNLPADEIAAAEKDEKAIIFDKKAVHHQPLGVSGLYGTQKQTVILVDHSDRVRFFERTIYDRDSNLVPDGEGNVDVTFQIER